MPPAPRYYEVDVHRDGRRVDDATFRVVINWHPEWASYTETQLNRHIEQVAQENRALSADPRAYVLRAYHVDEAGERSQFAWVWRWTNLPGQGERR